MLKITKGAKDTLGIRARWWKGIKHYLFNKNEKYPQAFLSLKIY